MNNVIFLTCLTGRGDEPRDLKKKKKISTCEAKGSIIQPKTAEESNWKDLFCHLFAFLNC